MPRDYQRQKNNEYRLPDDVYHQTIWIIRGYYRKVDELQTILQESAGTGDGMPRGSTTSDPVAVKAEKREALLKQVEAIEQAKAEVPEEYRAAVWRAVLFYEPYPIYADRHTYGRYKARFIFRVAKELGLY